MRGIGGRSLGADEKRDLLLDAAERTFTRFGFDGMTMSALAVEAEVTRPTVYAYFDSKDAVFAGLAERVRASFLQLQERADTATPADTIRSTLSANLDLFVRHHAILTVIDHRALSDERTHALSKDIYGRVHRRHTRFLQRLAAEGRAELSVPATTVVEAITGTTRRFAELVVADPGRENALKTQLVTIYERLVAFR